MRVRVAVGWRSQRARRESEEARADGARQRGRARGSRAVGSRARARTHEAVQLPAGIADLDTGLADVDGDNFTHGKGRASCEGLPAETDVCQPPRFYTFSKTKLN
jgi:hypothetical protein